MLCFPVIFLMRSQQTKKERLLAEMEKSYNFGLKMLDSSIVSKQTAWFDNNNRNNRENENFGVQK